MNTQNLNKETKSKVASVFFIRTDRFWISNGIQKRSWDDFKTFNYWFTDSIAYFRVLFKV